MSNESDPQPDPAPDSEPTRRSKDPLHGVTLEKILQVLVERLGWEEMGHRVNIRCFTDNPSLSSSLKFLRKTPWARTKVEALYIRTADRSPR